MEDSDYCSHNYQPIRAEKSDPFRDISNIFLNGEIPSIHSEKIPLEYECAKCGDRLVVSFK